MPASSTLPNDVATLKRLVVERDREIEHLKLQLARLRRWSFGASSEAIERAGQMPLTLEELQDVVAWHVQQSATDEASAAGESRGTEAKNRPVRRQRLPEHFERDENVIEPAESACAECGGELKKLGEPDAS